MLKEPINNEEEVVEEDLDEDVSRDYLVVPGDSDIPSDLLNLIMTEYF